MPTITPAQRRELAWQESLPARQRSFKHSLLKPITHAEGLARCSYTGEYSTLVLGPSESGKTYLAYRLARLAFLAGKDVIAMTADELRAKWLVEGGGDKWLAKLKRVPFLLIDDLGMENASDGWRAAIYEVINKREEEGLPTVVTANKTREFFAKNYSTGLANRLWRMEVVRL
jgi:DNA replication protein DnaC